MSNKIVKQYTDYLIDPEKKKEKGTKGGGLYKGIDAKKSKHSSWLFKEGGGYGENVTSNVSAIKEAYAGQIYQHYLPDNVAKTRIVEKYQEDGSKKLLVGSKIIKDYQDLSSFDFDKIPDSQKQTVAHDAIKAILLSRILHGSDFEDNFDNSGFSNEKGSYLFKKIDHGCVFDFNLSIKLNLMTKDSDGTDEPTSLLVCCINNRVLGLDNQMVWPILKEIIAQTNISQLRNANAPFEELLTREQGTVTEPQISDQITEDLNSLSNLLILKEFVEEQNKKSDIFAPLLAKLNSLEYEINPVFINNVIKECALLVSQDSQCNADWVKLTLDGTARNLHKESTSPQQKIGSDSPRVIYSGKQPSLLAIGLTINTSNEKTESDRNDENIQDVHFKPSAPAA